MLGWGANFRKNPDTIECSITHYRQNNVVKFPHTPLSLLTKLCAQLGTGGGRGKCTSNASQYLPDRFLSYLLLGVVA